MGIFQKTGLALGGANGMRSALAWAAAGDGFHTASGMHNVMLGRNGVGARRELSRADVKRSGIER